jgi:tetratricopeptide (TPR) repeat protein
MSTWTGGAATWRRERHGQRYDDRQRKRRLLFACFATSVVKGKSRSLAPWQRARLIKNTRTSATTSYIESRTKPVSAFHMLSDTWRRHWPGIAFACALALLMMVGSLLNGEGLTPNQLSMLRTITVIAASGMAAATLAWIGMRFLDSWPPLPGSLVLAGMLVVGATVVSYEKLTSQNLPLTSQIDFLQRTLSQERPVPLDAVQSANILQEIGDAETQAGRLEDAVQSYRRALELYQKVGDQRGIAASLTSISALGQTSGDYKSVEAEARTAISIYRGLDDHTGEANALASLGRLLRAEQRYEDSLAVLRRAENMYRSVGSNDGQLITRLDQALVLGRMEQKEKAISLVRGVYDSAVEGKNWLIAANASAALADLLSDTVEKASAYETASKLYQRGGAPEPARASFNKARQLAPATVTTHS